jgi:hypothetical protein
MFVHLCKFELSSRRATNFCGVRFIFKAREGRHFYLPASPCSCWVIRYAQTWIQNPQSGQRNHSGSVSIQAVSALEQFGQVKFTRAPCAETSSEVSAAPDFTIRPGLLSSTVSPAFRNSIFIFLRSGFFGFWHLMPVSVQ